MKLFSIVLFISLAYTGAFAQSNKAPSFTVSGEVLTPLTLTQSDLQNLKPAEAKVKDRDGRERLFKGVKLLDILDSAGVTLGQDLRGENLTKYVLVKAVDGYEVIFSLAELAPEFAGQTVLLVYEADGKPLAKGEGPFRLVVPGDKRPARWLRELSSIRVMFSKE